MTQQIINIGVAPNTGTGDPLRTAMQKANANFTELYNMGGGGGGTGGTISGPFTVNGTAGAPAITANGVGQDTAVVIAPGVAPAGAAQNVVGLDVGLGAQTTPDQWAMQVWGVGAAPGCSNGLSIKAGTNGLDTAFVVNTVSGTQAFGINGDASGALGIAPNQLSWSSTGAWTLPANWPGGGGGGGGWPPASPVTWTGTWTFVGPANATALVVQPAVSAAGQPQNVVGLLVEAGAQTVQQQWPMQIGFMHNAATNCSNGLLIYAGTSALDSPFTVKNVAGTNMLVLRGDSSGTLGSPVVTASGSQPTMQWDTAGRVTFVTQAFTSPGQWQWQIGSQTIASGSTAGNSNGMQVNAGTTNTDFAFQVNTDVGRSGGLINLQTLRGDGSGFIGVGAAGISWTNAGVFSFVGGASGNLGSATSGATHLSQLQDVSVTTPTPTNGQVLTYNAAGSNWIAAGAGGGTLAALTGDVHIASPTAGQTLRWSTTVTPNAWTNQPFTLASMSDMMAGFNPAVNQILQYTSAGWGHTNYNINTIGGVTIATLAVNQVLRWNGTAWANQMISLASLSDITITSPASGDVLTRNAANTMWINQQPTGGPGSLSLPTTLTNASVPFGLQVKQQPLTAPGEWYLQIGQAGSGAGAASGNQSGCSNGIFCAAGTTINDCCLWLMDDTGTNTFALIRGDSSGYIGPMDWGADGSGGVGSLQWLPTTVTDIVTTMVASGHYFRVGNTAVGGVTTYGQILNVDGSGSIGGYFWGTASGGQGLSPAPAAQAGGQALYIQASGVLSQQTSSRRYKRDIRDLSAEQAREILRCLRPVLYRSRCAGDDPELDHLGLIAEEVSEVCPWLVNYDENGEPQSVRYEKLPVLQLAAQG